MDFLFFDCNCMIGKRADRRDGEPWTLDQLLADMSRCGIADALVTHALSRDYDVNAGNEELAALIASHKKIHGCWAILPPSSDEILEPDEFIRAMLARRIAAAVAYPVAHTYSLSEWSMGRTLAALESHRIPLLLPFGQFTWEEVEAICKRHLYLPIIITGINYRQLRFLLPLWERYRNLFVDLSWFSIHDGLKHLASRGLLQQVMFGTQYPRFEPGAATTMVTFADIGDDQKQMVAGGTLRSIISATRRDRP